ncbi:hypothetical protein THTE_4093 [Thermogutta terrifontis]|uniref:Uncharacterized protein n=1 Tax=Thermogutta terrifontis TaxID=1331910 RepID=A0A286RL49_9BACT|nr:hypothetical protein THTE_4093 [Thermogutta terrifontis]
MREKFCIELLENRLLHFLKETFVLRRAMHFMVFSCAKAIAIRFGFNPVANHGAT